MLTLSSRGRASGPIQSDLPCGVFRATHVCSVRSTKSERE